MRNIDKGQRNRPQCPRWARALLLLSGAALLASAGRSTRADEPDAVSQANARYVAVTVCGTCHGVTGNSTQPKFPRLAAQKANYLVAQLKAFRGQMRGDPDAIGYMWGMASQLDDGSIAALAAYYAAQTPEPRAADKRAAVARGREIYEHGIASEGVPPCSACHGSDATGLQDFPRLAGQHAQYLLKQLASFQSSMRDVAIMHGVAQNLRLQEMEAVAEYLQALH
jgi:cytochrome c553